MKIDHIIIHPPASVGCILACEDPILMAPLIPCSVSSAHVTCHHSAAEYITCYGQGKMSRYQWPAIAFLSQIPRRLSLNSFVNEH